MDSLPDMVPTMLQHRDEMIATHAFDCWQQAYRVLHSGTMTKRAVHLQAMRQAFDALAAFIGEEIANGEGQ